jgi:TetR/AcrR family transcriptional regulator, mexJK operon transcriptional repressor
MRASTAPPPAAEGAPRASGERSGITARALAWAMPDDRPKPRAKEQEVLDVATEYFLRHGYQGTSINAMARASGISKESIYRYFSSKKQLFEAVIGRELIDYRDSLRRLDSMQETVDLREALLTIAETVLSLITTDRTLALRRLVFDETTRSPDVGQHYHEIGPEQAYKALENVFRSHNAGRVFDVATLSRYFIAMTSYQIIMERSCGLTQAPTKAETRAASERVVDHFIKAFVQPH